MLTDFYNFSSPGSTVIAE